MQNLGEGAFGVVYLGRVDFLTPVEPMTLVAIKTLKDVAEDGAKADFEREATILSNLQHESLIKLYGVSLDGETSMMIFEYMKHGDLNAFLRYE